MSWAGRLQKPNVLVGTVDVERPAWVIDCRRWRVDEAATVDRRAKIRQARGNAPLPVIAWTDAPDGGSAVPAT